MPGLTHTFHAHFPKLSTTQLEKNHLHMCNTCSSQRTRLCSSFTLSALFGLCTQTSFFSPFVRCLALSLQEHGTMCHCFTETKCKELRRLDKKVEKIWKQTEWICDHVSFFSFIKRLLCVSFVFSDSCVLTSKVNHILLLCQISEFGLHTLTLPSAVL